MTSSTPSAAAPPMATSQRLLPGRTEVKTPSTELVTWFDFTGGSLEDKVPAPRGTMKRLVTLLPGAVVDPDTKSFLEVDGRGQNYNSGKQTAKIDRAAGFAIPEFSVSLFYFIEYLYGGGATGSQTCSWQRILTNQVFSFEMNACAYPKPYIRGGPIKFDGAGIGTPKVWTHIALTRSPTETKLYFRGALVGTAPSPPLPANPEEHASLGTSLYGAVDDFRFYRGVLDATAIAALAQAGPSIGKPVASSTAPTTAPVLAK